MPNCSRYVLYPCRIVVVSSSIMSRIKFHLLFIHFDPWVDPIDGFDQRGWYSDLFGLDVVEIILACSSPVLVCMKSSALMGPGPSGAGGRASVCDRRGHDDVRSPNWEGRSRDVGRVAQHKPSGRFQEMSPTPVRVTLFHHHDFFRLVKSFFELCLQSFRLSALISDCKALGQLPDQPRSTRECRRLRCFCSEPLYDHFIERSLGQVETDDALRDRSRRSSSRRAVNQPFYCRVRKAP